MSIKYNSVNFKNSCFLVKKGSNIENLDIILFSFSYLQNRYIKTPQKITDFYPP